MSLLVHELVIGTAAGGGGGNPATKSSSNSVSLTPVVVTHPNSPVQVTHLQQRVVTINGNNSRRLVNNERSSKLADALAGYPPYTYSPTLSSHIIKSNSPKRASVHHLYSATSSFQNSNGIRPIKNISTAKAYVLPFVLQDHNYGAPPPSSPPPPQPISVPVSGSVSAIPTINANSFHPQSYKIHSILPSSNFPFNSKGGSTDKVVSSTPTKVYTKCSNIVDPMNATSVNKVGFVHVSNSSVSASHNNNLPSHVTNLPPHRQQFMPQPKPIYPCPYIPPPSAMSDSLMGQVMGISPSVSQDTDDESRVSEGSSSSSLGPSGEETETAPELEEGESESQQLTQSDDSITRCICNFSHDDGYMIQCDRCFVWQHVDCMEIDRNNIPDEYLCEACKPRITDRSKARSLQVRRRQQIKAHLARPSSSDSEDNILTTNSKNSSNNSNNKLSSTNKNQQDRKVLKKKKIKKKVKPVAKENKRQVMSNSSKNNSNITSINLSKFPLNTDDGKKRKRLNSSNCNNNNNNNNNDSSTVTVEECALVTTMEQVRAWIEEYEVAVTNHYSPELRAKIHAARMNGISPEFCESTQAALLGHRCRITPIYNPSDWPEDKVLIAATRLKSGTAIIEYQGKYTLKSQWGSVQIPSSLPYLPFVLQYNMQKEGLNICVDARTYGNNARFARRSNSANAEIRHVVERGSVHLYLVACRDIDEEEEITLPVKTAVCFQFMPSKPPVLSFPQAKDVCKNESNANSIIKEETSKSDSSPLVRRNGNLSSKKSLRKSQLSLTMPQPLARSSRRSTLSGSNDSKSTPFRTVVSSPTKERRRSSVCSGSATFKPSFQKPSHNLHHKSSPQKGNGCTFTSSEDLSSADSHNDSSTNEEQSIDASVTHKMTREERKIAAYMKAFERMEKAAQRRRLGGSDRKKEEKKNRSKYEEEELRESGGKNSYKEERPERKSSKKNNSRSKKGTATEEEDEDTLEEDRNDDWWGEGGERIKHCTSIGGDSSGYVSPPYSGIPVGGSGSFRFPKTKKTLMNEWLNETVDPVLHSSSSSGSEVTSGVPTCYMRSPTTPIRKPSSGHPLPSVGSNEVVDSRSAKKRWLRQAIIDGSEPPQSFSGNGSCFCSSPNSSSSRPDSPTGTDYYVTPLKKRRLARESMSSEQSNTPPSTPHHHHNSFEEKYIIVEEEVEELDHSLDDSAAEDDLPLKSEGDKINCGVKSERYSSRVKIENVDFELDDKLCGVVKQEQTEDDLPRHISEGSSSISGNLKRKSSLNRYSRRSCKRIKKEEEEDNAFCSPLKRVPNKKRRRKYAKKNNRQQYYSPVVDSLHDDLVDGDSGSNNNNSTMVKVDHVKAAEPLESADRSKTEGKEEIENVPESATSLVRIEKESKDLDEAFHLLLKSDDSDSIKNDGIAETMVLKSSDASITETNHSENSSAAEVKQEHGETKSEVVLKKPITLSKRKLSILEYRKRKSISSETGDDVPSCSRIVENIQEVELSNDTSIEEESSGKQLPPHTPRSASYKEVQGEWQKNNSLSKSCLSSSFEEFKPFPPPPAPPRPSLPLPDKDVLSDVVSKLAELDSSDANDNSAVKWNEAPTLLEQQRETLSERLRKEFGLRVKADNKSKLRFGITEKWRRRRNFGNTQISLTEDDDVSWSGGVSSNFEEKRVLPSSPSLTADATSSSTVAVSTDSEKLGKDKSDAVAASSSLSEGGEEGLTSNVVLPPVCNGLSTKEHSVVRSVDNDKNSYSPEDTSLRSSDTDEGITSSSSLSGGRGSFAASNSSKT